MQAIDWSHVNEVAVGLSIGFVIGYYLTRNRASDPRVAKLNPTHEAGLTALVGFLAFALADDSMAYLGRKESGSDFVVKYVVAVLIGMYRYADLVRSKRRLASQGR